MICAIVLAAGRSSRMGTQKLLLPLGKLPVITLVVDELLHSAVDEVAVVVSRDAEKVRAVLRDRAVKFVLNPAPDSDMLASVRCGLRALPAACEAVIVALGDQPTLRRELIDEIIRTFREQAKGIVLPTHNGRRGHPLLFAARYQEEVLTSHDDMGLRGLVRAHPTDVFELAVTNADVLEDMDTPEDYQRQKAKQAVR